MLVIRLLFLSFLVILGTANTITIAVAADWKGVPKGQKRLDSIKLIKRASGKDDSKDAIAEEKAMAESKIQRQAEKRALNDDIYSSGTGEILGAFGINFNDTLTQDIIVKNLGWTEITNLPEALSFNAVDTTLDMPTLHIKPPATPKLLANKHIAYRAFLGFDDEPLWLQAKGIPNIKEVITVLKRKYGKPNSESNQQLVFKRGDKALFFTVKRNRGTLDYYHLGALQKYLNRRKVSLREKYKETERIRLSSTEKKIFTLAERLKISSRSTGSLYGIDFQQRIGFLAKPDEYVSLPHPKPFKNIKGGDYKIMVSPDLMPIILRYEVAASMPEMRKIKTIFDHALELVYGGFLKKTSKHSVISFRGISLSVLIRSGKFSFSVLNNAENKLYNKRMKAKLLAERTAEAARLKVLADIEQARLDEIAQLKREKELAIARKKRKIEIKEETGF